MKVKALQRFYTGSGFCDVGQVVNVGKAKAKLMIEQGKAVKHEKNPIETKEEKSTTDTK